MIQERLPDFDEDRYEFRDELDSGGQGTVFLVYDSLLEREIALKLVDSDNEVLINRLVNEARITGVLDHPSIIHIHDLGKRSDGKVYFTMKYLKGSTLRKVLDQAKTYENRIGLLDNFIDVCNAIGFAHAKDYLHLDIKPSNIMMGEFGETYVVDWGLARKVNEKPTVYGLSHNYASPEFILFHKNGGEDISDIDARSDVFSLGAILYEILTGEKAFPGMLIQERLLSISKPPPNIKKVEPKVPLELIKICEKALAPDKENRYKNAQELVKELQDYKNEKIRADLPIHIKAVKWFRKNLLPISIFGVVLFFMLSSFFWSLAQEKKTLANISRARTLNLYGIKKEKDLNFNQAYFYHTKSYLNSIRIKSAPFSREKMTGLHLCLTPLERSLELSKEIVSFSISTRGNFVILNHSDQTVSILDLNTYNQTFSNAGKFGLINFTEQFLFILTPDNQVQIFQIPDFNLIKTIDFSEFTPKILGLSSDSSYLAVGTSDGRIKLCRWQEDEGYLTLEGHSSPLTSIRFIKNDSILVSGSKDGQVRIWDLDNIKKVGFHNLVSTSTIFKYKVKEGDSLKSIAIKFFKRADKWRLIHEYNPDIGHPDFIKPGIILDIPMLITSHDITIKEEKLGDRTIFKFIDKNYQPLFEKVINKDGDLLKTLMFSRKSFQAHASTVMDMDYTESGNILVTSGRDSTIKIWDGHGFQLIKSIKAHNGWVGSVQINKTGTLLLTSGYDKKVKLWNTGSWELEEEIGGNYKHVVGAYFHNNSEKIISVSDSSKVKIWSLKKFHNQTRFSDHTGSIYSVAFNKSGNWLASGGLDQTIKIYDLKTGSLKTEITEQYSQITSLCFNPENNSVISAGDTYIKIWNPETGYKIKDLNGHQYEVTAMGITPYGKLLISGDSSGTCILWSLNSPDKRILSELHHTGISTISINSLGNHVLTSDTNGNVIIWELGTTNILKQIQPRTEKITRTCFSEDGKFIALGYEDGDIYIIDTTNYYISKILSEHNTEISGLQFCENDNFLISSEKSGCTIIVWDLNNYNAKTIIQRPEGWIFSFDLNQNSNLLAAAFNYQVYIYSLTNLLSNPEDLEHTLMNDLDLYLLDISDNPFNSDGIREFRAKQHNIKKAIQLSGLLFSRTQIATIGINPSRNFARVIILLIFGVISISILTILEEHKRIKQRKNYPVYRAFFNLFKMLLLTLGLFYFIPGFFSRLQITPDIQSIIPNFSSGIIEKHYNFDFLIYLSVIVILSIPMIFSRSNSFIKIINQIWSVVPVLLLIIFISILTRKNIYPVIKELGLNIKIITTEMFFIFIFVVIIIGWIIPELLGKIGLVNKSTILRKLLIPILVFVISILISINLLSILLVRYFYILKLYDYQVL